MGSLPNLSDLSRAKAHRRALERERDRDLVIGGRCGIREFELSRTERDHMMFQVPTTACTTERALTAGIGATTCRERLPIFVHQSHVPPKYHQHRHSLTTRRVLRTRSSGATHHIWDDPMIEHMAAYSPISSRSHRTGIAPYQIQPTNLTQGTVTSGVACTTSIQSAAAVAAANRRRESINSSIGATSVRRLLTVNRACRHKIPIHVRAKVVRNFILLVIGHGLTSAALVPLIGLQGSNSTWFQKEKWLRFHPDIGSILLSFSFFLTSGMCLLTTRIIRKFGFIILLSTSYAGFCLFLSSHIYPTIYTLLPGYILLGLTLGPAWISKITLVVAFASKLSCTQPECNQTSAIDNNYDDPRWLCNRDENVRRLGRWYHAAQDIGIIVGALIATFILTCSTTTFNTHLNGCNYYSNQFKSTILPKDITIANDSNNIRNSSMEKAINDEMSVVTTENSLLITLPSSAISSSMSTPSPPSSSQSPTLSSLTIATKVSTAITATPPFSYYSDAILEETTSANELYIDNIFDINEQGERICGVHSCPVWQFYNNDFKMKDPNINNWTVINYSTQQQQQHQQHLPNVNEHLNIKSGTTTLIIIFLLMSIIALILTILSREIDYSLRYDPVRGFSDTLLFAGPLAYFIGTEQGYMLADFTKAFVTCSLGPHMVAGALVGMGIMQTIASCTLSMLLRHTKRIAVIAAGFFFHACLLLVLSRWKPAKDDSALFYVIAAAWGVCNAVWETLCFALVTLTHTNHVAEVASPLQALKYLGLGVTLAAHGFLCEGPKILVLAVLLVVSVPPYTMLEIRLEGQRKQHMSSL